MISIRLDGLDAVIIGLDKYAKFKPKPLMHLLGEVSRRQMVNYFTRGAGPTGHWTPLKPSTKRSGKPLTDTGRLKGSISYGITGAFLSVGTNVHYGKYHQYGTIWMAIRQFLGWGPKELSELEVITIRYLQAMAQ